MYTGATWRVWQQIKGSSVIKRRVNPILVAFVTLTLCFPGRVHPVDFQWRLLLICYAIY